MIQEVLESQKQYFASNETKNINFRINELKKLKATVIKYEDKIIEALRMDIGKSEYEAYTTEIGFVLNSITEFIKNIKKWTKDKKVKTPIYHGLSKSFTKYEPYGTVLVIAPFNYPFMLLMEPLIGAIASGNTVILKPSEMAKHTEEIIKKIIKETFSDKYVTIFTGGVEVTQELINSSVDYIFFTGSETVGKIVYQAAANNLVPVTLELGGKSPAIIDNTANIKVSTRRLTWGKFLNTGQTCIAPDYLYVHKDVLDEVLEEIKIVLNEFYENPKESPDYGKIINERHFDRLVDLIDSDKLYLGGKFDKDKLFIEPTVLTNVTQFDRVMQEEIFGPILPVIIFEDISKVIKEIKSNPKPLALYIFSENKQIQQKFINEVSFGGGCINDTLSHIANSSVPFGGVGSSGIGSYHGKNSIETFSHKKSILKKSTKLNLRIVFPPYKGKLDLVKRFLK